MKKSFILIFQLIIYCIILPQCALILNEDGYDPLHRHTENGLPIFYIHPAPISTEYCPVTLYYRGKEYQIEGKKRGGISLNYPKNNYILQFPDDHLFTDSEFQFSQKRNVILLSSFDDNSNIRNRLAYDIWNRINPDHIKIKTYSAIVYINGKYQGLYTIVEKVDGNLMADHELDRNGDLYKGVNFSANFYSKNNLHEGFEKKEGYPVHGEEDAYQTIDDFVQFISITNPDDFEDLVNEKLNRQEYEDWWIFITFMIASDSCSKNAYHYRNPNNGIWRYIPWDFNYSFGQDWKTYRTNYERNVTYIDDNNIFKRFLEDENIFGPLISRYSEMLLLENTLDINWILSRIDEYNEEIREAALKNEKKWQDIYINYKKWNDRNDFTSFDEEILYIKEWISYRHAYLGEIINKLFVPGINFFQ